MQGGEYGGKITVFNDSVNRAVETILWLSYVDRMTNMPTSNTIGITNQGSNFAQSIGNCQGKLTPVIKCQIADIALKVSCTERA